jgi:hypothetical protein
MDILSILSIPTYDRHHGQNGREKRKCGLRMEFLSKGLEKMLLRKPYSILLGLSLLALLSCGGGGGGSSSSSGSNPPAETTSTVTLSWQTPVSSTDGSPMADLSGFNIYYGKSPQSYDEMIDAGNVRTYVLPNIPAGTYYFAITAYDSSGNETDFSPEWKKNLP